MPTAVVTGAFSYTGRAVAAALLARGWTVRTLTNRVTPLAPLEQVVEHAPLQFEDLHALVSALDGASVLVNTYWIRYPRRGLTFDDAVANSAVLFAAAITAGVSRVVHVSVSNPSVSSPLDYYRGKAKVENIVRGLGASHAIVRPTLVVGPHDILVNNIAWFLRRFPVFAMPGSGAYRVQPITLDDLGEIVADAAADRTSATFDAAGPETMTFEALVRALSDAVGRRRRIVHLPPAVALALVRMASVALRDVVLAPQELKGLMGEALVSGEPPRGSSSVITWLAAHGADLGRRYASETRRHFSRG
jgi:NADH dehydrogenase